MSKDQLQGILTSSPVFAIKFRQSEAIRHEIIDAIVSQRVIIQAAYGEGLDKKLNASLSVNDKEQQMASLMIRKVVTEYAPVTQKDAEDYAKTHASQIRMADLVFGSELVFQRKENADIAWKALKNGTSFEKLAKKFSEDRLTAARGGQMDPLPMNPPSDIERAIASLKPHQYSAVTKIGDRYYIFRKEKVLLAPPPSAKRSVADAHRTLERGHLGIWLEKTKAAMKPVVRWDVINALADTPTPPSK